MLRYPGGKLRLQKRINPLIKIAYPESYQSEWVVSEPFTGGGGSLINMAEDFPLWKFHLNDSNPEIASLWTFFSQATDSDFNLLYDRIRSQEVTVKTYKEIFDSQPTDHIGMAFKIIFLNKTSYSGIVTLARPIGGWGQKSKWPVDIYWTPENIVKKIKRARNALAGRILSVSVEDFETFLTRVPYDFSYCDPPYIAFGKIWYSCKFGMHDLGRLKRTLQSRWCLSIDRIPETELLFNDCNLMGIDVKHTSKSSYKSKREDRSILSANEMVVFPAGTSLKLCKDLLNEPLVFSD